MYTYIYICIGLFLLYIWYMIICKKQIQQNNSPIQLLFAFKRRALASLCHGALTPKCRAVVRPLLLALREHLANVDGVNGVEGCGAPGGCGRVAFFVMSWGWDGNGWNLGGGNSNIYVYIYIYFCLKKSFTPKTGDDEPNLTIIFFEMGWWNHQPVIYDTFFVARCNKCWSKDLVWGWLPMVFSRGEGLELLVWKIVFWGSFDFCKPHIETPWDRRDCKYSKVVEPDALYNCVPAIFNIQCELCYENFAHQLVLYSSCWYP